MNRDPAFFGDTRFVVDRFHDSNHTCGESFSLKSFPQYSATNSQANEQANSETAMVKSMFSYMNVDNFHPSLSLFLYHRNVKKIEKLSYSSL